VQTNKVSQVGVWLSGRWFVSMLKHIANWLACIGFDCEIHIGIIGELCHNPNASIILQIQQIIRQDITLRSVPHTNRSYKHNK